jgi:hypothetical protein
MKSPRALLRELPLLLNACKPTMVEKDYLEILQELNALVKSYTIYDNESTTQPDWYTKAYSLKIKMLQHSDYHY